MKTIHELLKSLTVKVDTLVGDNKMLRSELEDIKRVLSATDERVQAVNGKLSGLTEDIRKQEEVSRGLQDEVTRLSGEFDDNLTKLDELEQYTRKNSLEIHGVPEIDATCEEILLGLAEKMEVDLRASDIEIIHRLQPRRGKNTTRSIILVKFQSHKKKREMYLAKKKLKDVRIGEIFEGVAQDNGKIYINENLTNRRKYLFGKLLALRKQNKILNTWTIDVKVNEHSNIQLIRNEQEIGHLHV